MYDATASRAVGTLKLRSQSLKQFSEFNGGQVLPLTESRANAYVKHLENGGAVATTAQRFVEAAILLCVISNSNVLHELVGC
eukprot:1950945-Amphidinium_carterae.1